MDTDNWDNGTYIIEDWNIKERLYQRYEDDKMKDSMFENLKYINDKQPKEEQLKEEELKVFAELWEIKHIDRLNDERKSYIEEKWNLANRNFITWWCNLDSDFQKSVIKFVTKYYA